MATKVTKCAKTAAPRSRNARGSGDRLRHEIVDAAITLLEKLGPEEPFSLRGVAKEAGIAAPSVYIQFEDRNLLLLAVLEQLFGEIVELRNKAEEKAARAGGGPWERLLASVLATVEFGLRRPGHYRVLYEGRVVLRLDDPKALGFGRQIQIRAIELIKEVLASSPAPRKEDPERLCLLLWAGVHGVISLNINKPTLRWPKAAELAEQIARLIVQPPEKKRRS